MPRYRPDVLEELARHGLAPGPDTPAARLREQINDLYRIEIRALRDRCRAGEFAIRDLPIRVVELRKRYLLLSIPMEQWTEDWEGTGSGRRNRLPAPVLAPGWYIHLMQRITVPYVRDERGGPLRPATWDEALTRAASGLRSIRDSYGGRAFGLFSCSKSTNEMNFAAQKFARVVMGSNNIDSCNRT